MNSYLAIGDRVKIRGARDIEDETEAIVKAIIQPRVYLVAFPDEERADCHIHEAYLWRA